MKLLLLGQEKDTGQFLHSLHSRCNEIIYNGTVPVLAHQTVMINACEVDLYNVLCLEKLERSHLPKDMDEAILVTFYNPLSEEKTEELNLLASKFPLEIDFYNKVSDGSPEMFIRKLLKELKGAEIVKTDRNPHQFYQPAKAKTQVQDNKISLKLK